MAKLVLALFQVSVLSLVLLAGGQCRVRRVNARVDPEVHMNTSQLITSKGYPCEEYDVHTEDGYILGIQRIPGGKNQHSDAPRPVVFLQHGLLSCSACWVENLANESLGFLLADAGFDVWLGNSRGNTYSKRHEHLNPKQKEFWDFTWDEMAKYDLPATVDVILRVSGASQLFYAGHSQGGGIAYAALSSDPELAKKIKLFVPLAPAAYLSAMRSPLKLLAPYSKLLPELIGLLGGDGEFMPHSKILTWLASEVCDKGLVPKILCPNILQYQFIHELIGLLGGDGEFMAHSKILTWLASEVCDRGLVPKILCSNILFIISGYDFKEMNETRLPVYVGQHPAGTSVRNIVHFAQTINDKNFGMFDFGPEENMKKYNQSTPPQYDVTKVTVPVAMYSGTNDWLVSPGDVTRLAGQTKHLIRDKVIDGWEHLDFIWAMDAPQDVYTDVISLFKQYT